MSKKVTTVIVGVGGYALTYLKKILDPQADLPVELVGGVDPFAQNSPMYNDLLAAGVPIYDTLEEFYAAHTAELAIIVTPIHLHKPQSIYCMEHGSHVLCEKPVAATIDDVQEMIETRNRTGKTLTIGYQWSHSEAIHQLKTDVLNGKYGKAIRFKAIVLWSRSQDYYNRGCGWAAHKKTANGDWILDSVAANATAHYLHNMLYVAGNTMDRSAQVDTIEVETYRANPIEMFDTCALRARTVDNVELLYLVSHAVMQSEQRNPEFVFEFENGVVTGKGEEGGIRVRGKLNDGTEIDYGFPNADDTLKLCYTVQIIRGESEMLCGPEAASVHTTCINRIEELIPNTPHFPQDLVMYDEPTRIYYCAGLAKLLSHCYDEWLLPYEADPVAFVPPQKGTVGHYTHFTPAE